MTMVTVMIMMFMIIMVMRMTMMTMIIFPVTTLVLATKVVQVEGIGQRARSRFVMMLKILMMRRWMMIFGQKVGSRYKL